MIFRQTGVKMNIFRLMSYLLFAPKDLPAPSSIPFPEGQEDMSELSYDDFESFMVKTLWRTIFLVNKSGKLEEHVCVFNVCVNMLRNMQLPTRVQRRRLERSIIHLSKKNYWFCSIKQDQNFVKMMEAFASFQEQVERSTNMKRVSYSRIKIKKRYRNGNKNR